ncbi:MAG: tetratricopeptide repeat protein, partial [Candidatus Auribacterota bacterium]|nr:tetratricopeptide repeat protein [Candidatus Auribacterota bacterium]
YMKNRRYYESYIHYQKALNIDPKSPSLHLGLANLYLLRGKLNKADQEARQVLVKSPSMARAYWIIAAAAEKRGDYHVAVEYYQKFLTLEPDQWEARLALGLLLHYHMKQSDRAERELEKVTALAPGDGRAYAVLGEIYLGRGDSEEALKAVEQSLKYDPETYQALIIRGQLYMEGGDDLRAEKLFKEALQVNPDGVLAIYWTGMILFQQGNYQAAESHFKKASGLAPQFRDAVLNHGLVLEVLGRRSEALRRLQGVVKDNPDFALGHLGLGRLLYYSGKSKKALPYFRNALALDRSLWEPFYFIGRCLHDRGDIVESLEYYLLARKLENENPQLLTDLAIAYAETNCSSRAEELLNEALSVDPNYLRAMIQLGLLKARKDDFRGADSIYRQALILRPGDVSWGNQEEQKDFLVRMVTDVEDYLGSGIDYMSLYGVIKNMSGEQEVFSELIPILQEKLRSHPFQPEYPHLLGMAYQDRGDSVNAEKYYLRAVRNDSDFAAAHLSLGQLYAGQKKYDQAREHLQGVLSLVPDSALAPAVREILDSLPKGKR